MVHVKNATFITRTGQGNQEIRSNVYKNTNRTLWYRNKPLIILRSEFITIMIRIRIRDPNPDPDPGN